MHCGPERGQPCPRYGLGSSRTRLSALRYERIRASFKVVQAQLPAFELPLHFHQQRGQLRFGLRRALAIEGAQAGGADLLLHFRREQWTVCSVDAAKPSLRVGSILAQFFEGLINFLLLTVFWPLLEHSERHLHFAGQKGVEEESLLLRSEE